VLRCAENGQTFRCGDSDGRLSHIKELIAWRASKTLSCQRETLHSQQLRSIKKSIDSDHGIYRDLRNVVAKYPFERSHGFPGIQPNLATETLRVWRLGFGGVDPEATGRPAYHPSVLLKLYIYGYLHRVQSSRRLEREAGRNVEVMWLTGRLAPITRRLLISARITVLRSARCMRDLTSRRPLGAREFSQRSRRPSRYAPAMLIP
jgi:hypothetical protein